jgi:hypothetical protein
LCKARRTEIGGIVWTSSWLQNDEEHYHEIGSGNDYARRDRWAALDQGMRPRGIASLPLTRGENGRLLISRSGLVRMRVDSTCYGSATVCQNHIINGFAVTRKTQQKKSLKNEAA